MPKRWTVATLRKSCMVSLVKHWDLICYSVHSPKEMANLLETDSYLEVDGPFSSFPSTVLEDLMDVIRSMRNLTRKFLHLLLREQLLKLNLSIGVGEVYFGLQFLTRCTRLQDLSLSYLRDVEPSHIIPITPYLKSLLHLNLSMTAANDALLWNLAQYCPNLQSLNLQSTYISDDGVRSLCGLEGGCGQRRVAGCLRLQKMWVVETRVTWVGAYALVKALPELTDLDFDKIFQVFEHLDPSSIPCDRITPLKLRTLYSTTPAIRGESLDSVAQLCPCVELIAISNTWIDNETFYKVMQFENLRSLEIFNSEGKILDYGEGVLPVLQVVGGTLENLILSNFREVELISLGKSCPRLRKLALSSITDLTTDLNNTEIGIFTRLTNLELWLESDDCHSSYQPLLQLLQNSILLENLLIRKSNAFDINLLRKVLQKNPMRHLSRVMWDHCGEITPEVINELLGMENELTTIRIWTCPKVTMADRKNLMQAIKQNNYYVYFEWFE